MACCPQTPGEERSSRVCLGSYFFRRFTEGQCRRLREHICQKHVVMRAELVERAGECDEVARNQPGSLVYQLIKRVLPICARLAPVDRTGLVLNDAAFRVARLPLLSIVNCCRYAGNRLRYCS